MALEQKRKRVTDQLDRLARRGWLAAGEAGMLKRLDGLRRAVAVFDGDFRGFWQRQFLSKFVSVV